MTLRVHAAKLSAIVALALGTSALAVPSPAHAQGASLQEATDAQKQEAKEHYRAGMAAFGEQRYDEALERFQKSYQAVSSPNSHLMIARALARQNRTVEAYSEFKSVAREAEEAARTSQKYAETAAAAATELKEIAERVGFVRVTAAGQVRVGEEQLTPNAWGEPVAVVPGPVKVSWTLPDGSQMERTADVTAGQTIDIELSPPRPPASAPAEPVRPEPAAAEQRPGINQRTLAYVIGGIGAGGLATFAVFGALNNARFDDLESQCPNGVCSPALADEAERGRRFQAVANAGLGIGIAGIATGVVLFLTAPSRSKQRAAPRTPSLSVTARSVSVHGRF